MGRASRRKREKRERSQSRMERLAMAHLQQKFETALKQAIDEVWAENEINSIEQVADLMSLAFFRTLPDDLHDEFKANYKIGCHVNEETRDIVFSVDRHQPADLLRFPVRTMH